MDGGDCEMSSSPVRWVVSVELPVARGTLLVLPSVADLCSPHCLASQQSDGVCQVCVWPCPDGTANNQPQYSYGLYSYGRAPTALAITSPNIVMAYIVMAVTRRHWQ